MLNCVDNFFKCHCRQSAVVTLQRGGFGMAFELRTFKGIVATRDKAHNIKKILSIACDERDDDGNITTRIISEKKDVANFLKFVFPNLQCDAIGKTKTKSATMAMLYLSRPSTSYKICGYIN